jgi:hypothetical protein
VDAIAPWSQARSPLFSLDLFAQSRLAAPESIVVLRREVELCTLGRPSVRGEFVDRHDQRHQAPRPPLAYELRHYRREAQFIRV